MCVMCATYVCFVCMNDMYSCNLCRLCLPYDSYAWCALYVCMHIMNVMQVMHVCMYISMYVVLRMTSMYGLHVKYIICMDVIYDMYACIVCMRVLHICM